MSTDIDDKVPTLIRGTSVSPDLTFGEALAQVSTAQIIASRRLLSVKENTEEDFYQLTQNVRQAVVEKYVQLADIDTVALRDNLDADDVRVLLTTLKDIDAATNNREKIKTDKDKNQDNSEIKTMVAETLRTVTDQLFQRQGYRDDVPKSELGSRQYVEGEMTPLDVEDTTKDLNYFKSKMKGNKT